LGFASATILAVNSKSIPISGDLGTACPGSTALHDHQRLIGQLLAISCPELSKAARQFSALRTLATVAILPT
jgi:hypothetical protein